MVSLLSKQGDGGMADTQAPLISHDLTTNQALVEIAEFIFVDNMVLSIASAIIVGVAVYLSYCAGRIDDEKILNGDKCAEFRSLFLADSQAARSSTSQFLVAFLISVTVFMIGVAFEKIGNVSGILVQAAGYVPTLVIAIWQISSTWKAIGRLQRHAR